MKLSTNVKSVSYLKSNIAQMLDQMRDDRQKFLITQNGEARAVVMSVEEYEEWEQRMTMLKLIAFGEKEIAEGKVRPFEAVVKEMKKG